jgi:hypothetical protein
MVFQDSLIGELNRQLLIKPTFKKATQTDFFVGAFFVGFSLVMAHLTL